MLLFTSSIQPARSGVAEQAGQQRQERPKRRKYCSKSMSTFVHISVFNNSITSFPNLSPFQLMLDSWNSSIFSNIKHRLQNSAMKLIHAERNGEAFDSQLVIGVRESYVNLCSNPNDRLQIYRDNFEKAYLEATDTFYIAKAPQYLEANGVQNYMYWADMKLKEEEQRAGRYLESYSGSVQTVRSRKKFKKLLINDFFSFWTVVLKF